DAEVPLESALDGRDLLRDEEPELGPVDERRGLAALEPVQRLERAVVDGHLPGRDRILPALHEQLDDQARLSRQLLRVALHPERGAAADLRRLELRLERREPRLLLRERDARYGQDDRAQGETPNSKLRTPHLALDSLFRVQDLRRLQDDRYGHVVEDRRLAD